MASLSGTIISLAAVATGVSASVLGHLTGRCPFERLLLVTLVAGMMLCVPLALVQSPLQLLLVRVLLGLFAGGSLTLVYALANLGIPGRRAPRSGCSPASACSGAPSARWSPGRWPGWACARSSSWTASSTGWPCLWRAGTLRASSERPRRASSSPR